MNDGIQESREIDEKLKLLNKSRLFSVGFYAGMAYGRRDNVSGKTSINSCISAALLMDESITNPLFKLDD